MSNSRQKVAVVGAKAVGKTAFIDAMRGSSVVNTIVNIEEVALPADEGTLTSMATSCDLIYLLFDPLNSESVKNIQQVYSQLINVKPECLCIAWATKADLRKEAAQYQSAQEVIAKLGLKDEFGMDIGVESVSANSESEKINKLFLAQLESIDVPSKSPNLEKSDSSISPAIPKGLQLLKDARNNLNKVAMDEQFATLKRKAEIIESCYEKYQQSSSNENYGAYLRAIDDFTSHANTAASGQRSLKRIVIGSILAFLGVALMLAAIPLYCFPPAGLAAQAVALKLVVAGMAVAGLTTAAGFGFLAFSGREKGVASESRQYAEVAKSLINN